MDDTESRPAAQRSLKAKLQEELAANVELEVRMPDDTARAVINRWREVRSQRLSFLQPLHRTAPSARR